MKSFIEEKKQSILARNKRLLKKGLITIVKFEKNNNNIDNIIEKLSALPIEMIERGWYDFDN